MRIVKIVLTGGPCAGKSTSLHRIRDAFTALGYNVLLVSETATELIDGGVAPWTCRSRADFQNCRMRLQTEKEAVYEQAAAVIPGEKTLLVCDRGTLDNRAYLTDAEFSRVLADLGKTEGDLRNGYDAVFHLVTAAKGAEAFYTTENNPARVETAAEAARLDDRLLSAWVGHPHFRVIDNSTDFEGKMERLLAEIRAFLGEPESFEIERKFLIEYPDVRALERDPFCRRVEILQTYLTAPAGEERRLRRWSADGGSACFLTVKRAVSGVKRVEHERRIPEDEYLRLLSDADASKRQIRKTRYCLLSENRCFEIDLYPFWQDKAIAEIELLDESETVTFPAQLRVIREVTGDERYRNATLAAL